VIYFDLANYVRSQLKLNKITKIDMKNTDTFVKRNNFFSARRSLRLKHDDYGRNISIIMIN
jgi:copper oxidase (laccase) domain-containing protein